MLFLALLLVAAPAEAKRRPRIPDWVRNIPVRVDIEVNTGYPASHDGGDVNAAHPLIGYWYTKPNRLAGEDPVRYRETSSYSGYVGTEGASVFTLFVMPDDYFNISSITIQRPQGRVRKAAANKYVRQWDKRGWLFAPITQIDKRYVWVLRIEYENDLGEVIGASVDSITIDTKKY